MVDRGRAVREPTLLILTVLADRPRHGYAPAQEVLTIPQGRVRLRTGTLYGSIERFQGEGVIGSFALEWIAGRPRRTYTLTRTGRNGLAAEVRRITAGAREATRRLKQAITEPTGAPA
ncbi:PadR family transcriptional regulator [Streptomyces sp. NPDC048462]|uniref:PadR family transcriptional regulator n=1 Tax=Streptomyces sp. NPDC048462 TaxID=3365555 RepID=UPI003710913C